MSAFVSYTTVHNTLQEKKTPMRDDDDDDDDDDGGDARRCNRGNGFGKLREE